MSSEHKIDLSKLTDYDFSLLIVKRNVCQFEAEQLDELLNRIGETKGLTEPTKQIPIAPTKNEAPLLSEADFDKLPWKSYKTKEIADANEAGRIFSDTKGAETLLAVLKTKDKAQIGTFEYQLQGNKNQFIARNPIKTKN